MRRVIIAGVMSATVVLTAAACSGSSGSSAAGTTTPTSSTSASSTASASTGGVTLPTPAQPANGAPLKVFFFNEQGASSTASDPGETTAAEAAVDYINKNLGGIKGRPIALTTCASLGTAASSASCANQAVADKADIVIKGLDPEGEAAVPIVTGAGIPYLTLNAGAAAELDNPLSFVPASGYPAEFGSFAPYSKSKGYKSVVAIYTNVEALSSAVDSMGTAFKEEGIAFTGVPVDITTADLTSAYSAALTKKPDLIIVLASLAQCTATLQARVSLGDTTPLGSGPSCDVPNVLSSIPASSLGNVVYANGDTSAVPSDLDTRIYEAAMAAYEPGTPTTGLAPTSFSSLMDFYNAAMTVANPATLDAATIAKALQTATSIPLWDGDGKDYSCAAHYFTALPSACSPWAYIVSQTPSGAVSLIGSYNMSTLLR
jgi:branched-chain amino acid transport system substrate-binding protein